MYQQAYPSDLMESNLLGIKKLKEKLINDEVGLSDHKKGLERQNLLSITLIEPQ